VVIIVGAALGLIALLARRSLWRAVSRAVVVLLLFTVVASVAVLVAGSRWPWVAASVVLLVTLGVTWKTVRWARAVNAVGIARLVWFGWQWIMDVRDSRAWARTSRPLPPHSS
jgi:Ca2+/Na+ antiporter